VGAAVVQWRATKDFRDVTFLGPRIVDKLVLALIIMTLYWRVGENHKLSNYNNLAAVLFLWTILPGYAAAAFIPTIVLERPLFVRSVPPVPLLSFILQLH
jgi:ATP-binding cassette subfamily G (WHITE) protein 2